MRKTAGFLLVAFAFILVAFRGDKAFKADLNTIKLIKAEGLDNSKVMQTLFELTDVNGPRLTNSTGMKNAEKWCKERLESFGLENAHIEPWGGFGKGWEINKSYVAMTAPYYQALIAVPKAWTPGTNGLVSGNAILVKIDLPEDAAKYAGKLRGKIVVIPTPNDE